MDTSFAALSISRNGNGYKTASHKGLQSFYNLPATEDAVSSPSAYIEHLSSPTADTILGPPSLELQVSPRKATVLPQVLADDVEYHMQDSRALYSMITGERYISSLQELFFWYHNTDIYVVEPI